MALVLERIQPQGISLCGIVAEFMIKRVFTFKISAITTVVDNAQHSNENTIY